LSSPPRYSSLRPGTRAQWWTSWWLAATLGLAIVAVAAGPVVAQPASSGRQARADASVGDPEAPPETRDAAQADEYRVAVAEGTDAFRAGRYQDARAAFQRAYEIHADHVLLFNIASCWRRTGDTDAAIAA